MTHVSGFPMNIVEEIEFTFNTYFNSGEFTVVTRPIRYTDPARTVSIFVTDGAGLDDSKQIGQLEPALNRYQLRAQSFVRHAVEMEGRALSALDAKTVRAVLYRDQGLAATLPTLVEELLGTRETLKRHGVGRTRFLNNEVSGAFLYLAQIDLWAETEMVEL